MHIKSCNKNFQERGSLQDLGVCVGMILKQILKKYNRCVKAELNSLKACISGRSLSGL
jgi:hypothetical protein